MSSEYLKKTKSRNDFDNVAAVKISRVIIVINRTKPHAHQTAGVLKSLLEREKVQQEWTETLPPRKNLCRKMPVLRDLRADLLIAIGGDGTLLQAAHRFRGSGVPVLGINTEPIEMQLDATSGPAEVRVDGLKLARLTPASTITVKTSADSVPIAFRPEINYYDVLAEKLKWRGDGLSKPKYGHA